MRVAWRKFRERESEQNCDRILRSSTNLTSLSILALGNTLIRGLAWIARSHRPASCRLPTKRQPKRCYHQSRRNRARARVRLQHPRRHEPHELTAIRTIYTIIYVSICPLCLPLPCLVHALVRVKQTTLKLCRPKPWRHTNYRLRFNTSCHSRGGIGWPVVEQQQQQHSSSACADVRSCERSTGVRKRSCRVCGTRYCARMLVRPLSGAAAAAECRMERTEREAQRCACG